jgi:hypothetical protein
VQSKHSFSPASEVASEVYSIEESYHSEDERILPPMTVIESMPEKPLEPIVASEFEPADQSEEEYYSEEFEMPDEGIGSSARQPESPTLVTVRTEGKEPSEASSKAPSEVIASESGSSHHSLTPEPPSEPKRQAQVPTPEPPSEPMSEQAMRRPTPPLVERKTPTPDAIT